MRLPSRLRCARGLSRADLLLFWNLLCRMKLVFEAETEKRVFEVHYLNSMLFVQSMLI